jgi:hypothetical protein
MKRSIIGLSLFVGLWLMSISAVAQATSNNLVQNGSLEDGYEDTTGINGGWPSNHGFWAPIGYFGATDTIPHWTVSGGGVDWHDSDANVPNSMRAADGDRLVDLNSAWGNAPGVISQTIATTPGVSYALSFSYSGHPHSGCYFGPKPMRASAGSASTTVSADPLAEGYLDGANIWHAASLSFTASSTSTVISFMSLENDGTCAGPLVDDVRVLPQPSAQPQPVLDQSQTVGGWGAGGLDQWQSFIAGKTGLLTRLDLSVGSGLIDESQAGVLRIYAGEGTGGSLLATQEVTFQYVFGFQTFQFSTPAPVHAGGLYTYRLSIPRINVGWVDLNLNNPYPNGRASHDPGADYLFRTYVTRTNNLVQNGSFEEGYENTTGINGGWPSNHGLWAPIGYFGATDTIPHWTASGGGVDWHDADVSVPNSMRAADGDRLFDLNSAWGNAPGVISQTIATTPGAWYALSFSYSGHPYSGCYFGPKPMRANAGSASTTVSADPLAEGYLDGTNLWHTASLNFKASNTSTVISFTSLENDGTCAGPLVDDVWVLPLPPSAQPELVLDQSQTVGGWGAGGLDQWQSFTAGKTGLLTRLDLEVESGLVDQPQAGVLRIYAGEGTGGPLLATQEVTFQYEFGFQTFQFSTPALVQAGSLYTYRFSIPQINVGWVSLNLNDPYPNGRASHAPEADYLFRTYVTPPVAAP